MTCRAGREPRVYRRGIYAPSLRHHKGHFYLAVTPVGQHTRLCKAAQVQGPWDCHELDREAFDPGLFFDTDGKAYVVTSASTDGTITLLSLSEDLKQVTNARKIHSSSRAPKACTCSSATASTTSSTPCPGGSA